MTRRRKIITSLLILTLLITGTCSVPYAYWYSQRGRYEAMVNQGLAIAEPKAKVGIWSAPVFGQVSQPLVPGLAWNRKEIAKSEDIAEILYKAIVAIEDERFYDRSFSPDERAKFRAGLANLKASWKAGKWVVVEGGSSITEQLTKNAFWDKPEQDWRRKRDETGLARVVEARWTKQQILVRYLNEVYLGDGSTPVGKGFKSAARGYFGLNSLKDIQLEQAAMLAGMLSNPNKYSPILHPEAAKSRRNLVLDKMAELGFIDKTKADNAKAMPLGTKPVSIDGEYAPHFAGAVQAILPELTGGVVKQTDLTYTRVQTYLDQDLQAGLAPVIKADADSLASSMTKDGKDASGLLIAFVFADKSGNIRTYFGSQDYKSFQYDYARNGHQIGSLFKPNVVAEALQEGKTLADMWTDSPPTGTWPKNYDGSNNPSPFTTRQVLRKSRNVGIIEIGKTLDLTTLMDDVARAGLPRPDAEPVNLLGAKEATLPDVLSNYLMWLNLGQWQPTKAIEEVRNAADHPLTLNYPGARQVFSPQASYLVVDVLRDVIRHPEGTAHGIAGKLSIKDKKTGTSKLLFDAFGKSGTTQTTDGKNKEAWFAGCMPGGCGVVWVAFHDSRPLGLTGGQAAAPIWADLMKKIAQIRPSYAKGQVEKPEGIEERPVGDGTELFITGQTKVSTEVPTPEAIAAASPTPAVSSSPSAGSLAAPVDEFKVPAISTQAQPKPTQQPKSQAVADEFTVPGKKPTRPSEQQDEFAVPKPKPGRKP